MDWTTGLDYWTAKCGVKPHQLMHVHTTIPRHELVPNILNPKVNSRQKFNTKDMTAKINKRPELRGPATGAVQKQKQCEVSE